MGIFRGPRPSVHAPTGGEAHRAQTYSAQDLRHKNNKQSLGRQQPERQVGHAGESLQPTELPGDVMMSKGTTGARTSNDMDNDRRRAQNEDTFADPTRNVAQLGIREGMKVADFGSGSGAYALALGKAVGTTGHVFAVDVQRDLLVRLQNLAVQMDMENIEVLWGNIEEAEGSNIASELLDLVLISNTLFQTEDKITTIKEAWRVLKENGILAIIDWSESFGGLGPSKDAIVSNAEAILLCTDNGFLLKKNFSAGEHHYGLLFAKMSSGTIEEDVRAHSSAHGAREEQDEFIKRTISQELA